MDYDWKIVGRYLKEQRQLAGLSQIEVSKKLGYASAQFLSNIERGTAGAPNDILKKLMKLYLISPKKFKPILNKAIESKIKKELG